MIYNYELEKQLLAALIKEPESYSEVANFISSKDFYSEDSNLHGTIFTIIKQSIDSSEEIDEVIIAQRVNSLGLSFEDRVNPSDYIRSLAMRKVPKGNLIKTAKELKKFTVRREIFESAQEIAKRMKGIGSECSYTDIIESADSAYNSKINLYEIGNDLPENIYDEMEFIVEDRGNNPVVEFGMMGPHKKVNEIYGSLLRPGNITVVVARSGVGKSLANYERVITDIGLVRMDELKMSDKILSQEGSFVELLGIFPQGKQKSYEITFIDNRKIHCSSDHIWTVWMRQNGQWQWLEKTTEEIINFQSKYKNNKIYIPLNTHQEYKQEADINPYLLGCLIGDGSFEKTSICITNQDHELIEKLSKIIEFYDCQFSLYRDKEEKCPRYGIKANNHGHNQVLFKLRELGLIQKCKEKMLPESVFKWSIIDRINLIQGLMDTDGYVSKTGSLEFSTSSATLSKQFQKLIWSIGGICKISYRKNLDSYRCNIRYFNPRNLVSLTRKINRISKNYQYKDLNLRIKSISQIEDQDSTCISIDSPSKLFVTENYIVTHNTQFCMDYGTKVAIKYGIPVLHFDNGEMSKEELVMRQCAALSGVPMHLIETGEWRRAGKEIVDRIRAVWPKIKEMKFYYYNVGGMDVDSMIKTLKRFYYGKVGRGNQMIFSFDYIKTTSESGGGKNEWQVVGEMVDKFKKCVQKEILHEGNPIIPMITSVQSNRSGITNNRNSQNVIDDESVVSLSDRITQFCSHMFILRNKTADEIETEGRSFGTHKLINVKARHLGKDIAGAVEPIRIGDALRKNFINLDFKNFAITEKGDLRDIARFMDGNAELEEDEDDDLPDFN
jgi:replicative DNA helicase